MAGARLEKGPFLHVVPSCSDTSLFPYFNPLCVLWGAMKSCFPLVSGTNCVQQTAVRTLLPLQDTHRTGQRLRGGGKQAQQGTDLCVIIIT